MNKSYYAIKKKGDLEKVLFRGDYKDCIQIKKYYDNIISDGENVVVITAEEFNKNIYYVIESEFLHGSFRRNVIFKGTLKECSEEVDYQRKRLAKYYSQDELHEHNFYIIAEEDINKDLKKVYGEY